MPAWVEWVSAGIGEMVSVAVSIDGRPGLGHIVSPIDAPLLDQFEADWQPFLAGEPDAGWNWRAYAAEYSLGLGGRTYALVAAGRLQGMVAIRDEVVLRSPEDGTATYVAYLATAPWNRRNRIAPVGGRPRVKPVGTVLMDVAIAASWELQHEGRLAWHSEPGAELWYRAILPGAVVFLKDWDGERELTYFEADGAVTRRFSQRNGYRLQGVLT